MGFLILGLLLGEEHFFVFVENVGAHVRLVVHRLWTCVDHMRLGCILLVRSLLNDGQLRLSVVGGKISRDELVDGLLQVLSAEQVDLCHEVAIVVCTKDFQQLLHIVFVLRVQLGFLRL